MPILRDEDPRVGCLAVPVSAVAGFILFALVAAAVGVSAGVSGVVGLVGAAVGSVAAVVVLRRD